MRLTLLGTLKQQSKPDPVEYPILTNTLFFGSMQVGWIENELHLGIKDKFPFFHIETFLIYAVVLAVIYFAASPFFGWLKMMFEALTHILQSR